MGEMLKKYGTIMIILAVIAAIGTGIAVGKLSHSGGWGFLAFVVSGFSGCGTGILFGAIGEMCEDLSNIRGTLYNFSKDYQNINQKDK